MEDGDWFLRAQPAGIEGHAGRLVASDAAERQSSPDWRSRDQPWWVKTSRAAEHVAEVRRRIDEFKSRKPYAVVYEPTGMPARAGFGSICSSPFRRC
jgi:hypothetical protein